MAQIPDDFAQELLEDMHEKGRVWAKAKGKARHCEELRKIAKATLMRMARAIGEASSRESAESWAYTHPQYKQASDIMVAAIEEEASAQVAYDRAQKEWETWRSLNANDRNIR